MAAITDQTVSDALKELGQMTPQTRSEAERMLEKWSADRRWGARVQRGHHCPLRGAFRSEGERRPRHTPAHD